jgi:tRNA U34 5-methylaminomethyl-2-thiouridine-forming methyltransferase MnmC
MLTIIIFERGGAGLMELAVQKRQLTAGFLLGSGAGGKRGLRSSLIPPPREPPP